MNLLQSFMSCMYPGSIRTESIESMDNPDCRFQVSNIDERESVVSRGELQLTDRDLIYFNDSKFPTRWPLYSIRRYGCSDQGNKFIFEVGRRCATGEAIFAFRLSRATELVERLKEKIERCEAANSVDSHQDEASMNNRLNNTGHQHTFNTTDNNKTRNQQVPHLPDLVGKTKQGMATSTDLQAVKDSENADPRPLSYASIDFPKAEALTKTAQSHAASRIR